jgi:hypothetical protein
VRRGWEGKDGEKRGFKYVKEKQGKEGSRANLVLPTVPLEKLSYHYLLASPPLPVTAPPRPITRSNLQNLHT